MYYVLTQHLSFSFFFLFLFSRKKIKKLVTHIYIYSTQVNYTNNNIPKKKKETLLIIKLPKHVRKISHHLQYFL